MNNKTSPLFFVITLMLVAFLGACSPATPEATPSPTPLPPTVTPIPPTETPVPTSMPVPKPSLKNMLFATTQDMAAPKQPYLTFDAGPKAMFVSFQYADVPAGARVQLHLSNGSTSLLDKDEALSQAGSGTAVLLISDAPHILTPGSYDLEITLAGQTLTGRYLISATKGQPGASLVVDNFDDNFLAWDSAASKVKDGELFVNEDTANYVAWTYLQPDFEDFDLATDVRQSAGPSDGYYGIVFRQTGDDHYIFELTVDGYFDVGISSGGKFKALVASRSSSAIKRGKATNHIRVIAKGDTFAFYINAVQVATAKDNTLRRGSFGLLAGNYETPGMIAAYDNLVMTLPTGDIVLALAKATPQGTPGPKPTSVPTTPPLVSILFQTIKNIQDIGGAMDRIYHGGGGEACAPLLADYNGVVNAPVYDMNGQPGSTTGAYGLYRQAISIIADRIKPIQQVCASGGGSIGNQDFNNARTAINDAGDLLGQALQLMGQ